MDGAAVKSPHHSKGVSGRAHSVFSSFKLTAKEWIKDNAMRLSAALSLYTLLSLAPLLVITIKVVGLFLRNKEVARDQVTNQMTSLMGFQASSVVQPILESGARPHGGMLASIVSILVLVFSATGVFVELQDSMNLIWNIQAPPHSGVGGFIKHRLLSTAMVFGIAFLLLASMFISTILTGAANYFAGDAKGILFVVDVLVSSAVVSTLFAAIYKFLPDREVRWSSVWSGALLSGIMFSLGKYGLAMYFKYGTPTSAFGAAGTLAAVVIWVYYSSFILFFGAEFTKVRQQIRSKE